MFTNRTARLLIIVLLSACIGSSAVQAQDTPQRLIVAADGAYQTIEAALAAAESGDIIEVQGGIHPAPLTINKTVTLLGINRPIIDGNGTGSLVIITAPDTRLEGFVVRHSGESINHEDTGIVIQAPRVTIANNVVEAVLFGIYFANAHDGIAENNTIRCYEREMGVRGDGIRVWYSNNLRLTGNDVALCRDTLIWYAEHVLVENNTFRDSRYGLHIMYSSHTTVINNLFEGNSVGSYFMYSQHLTMTNNQMMWNRGPSGYGAALKDMDYVTFSDNVMVGNRAGLYIDNSPALYDITNTITANFFGYNDIGITALPSTRHNLIQSNTMIENNQQVSVLGRGNLLENSWHQDGIGNYWSDYVGYDGDGDGVGDSAYRAEKLFESLMDNEPALRLFMYSPASQAIDFAASAFPSLRPDPKVIDESPLMQPAVLAVGAAEPQGVSLPFLALCLILSGAGIAVYVFAIRGHVRRPIIASPQPAGTIQAGA